MDPPALQSSVLYCLCRPELKELDKVRSRLFRAMSVSGLLQRRSAANFVIYRSCHMFTWQPADAWEHRLYISMWAYAEGTC